MGKVNVIVVDATGNKEQKVGLPDDIKCGIIMVKLAEKIKLPSVGPDGNPISYKFIHKVTGRQLLETQTLSEAGIKDGDVLRLQPEITAGALCPHCNAEIQEGAAFCTKCGRQIPEKPVAPVAPAAPAAPMTPEQPEAAQPTQAKPAVNAVPPVYTPPVYNPQLNNASPLAGKNFKPKGSIFNVFGFLGGILSFILGIILACFSTGYSESSYSYGGDAYTGIQNASAQTANNIQDLAAITKFGLSALLAVAGIALIAYFGSKAFGEKK